MVADTDNPKTPLVKIEMQRKQPDADLVLRHLEKDNEAGIQQLLQNWNFSDVLHPRGKGLAVGTSLHIAATHGAEKCLKVLLSHRPSKEEIEAPDVDGQTALLTAVANAQPTALNHLLNAGANVNARGDNRRGALHLLVLALAKDSSQAGDLLKVADLLLSSTYVNKLDLEPHANLAGLTDATPLAVAAAKLKENKVDSLLELCKKLVKAGASLSGDAGGATVEQVLNQKGCLTEKVLNERNQPHSRPTASHVVDVVCMGGGGGEVREVLQGKRAEEAREAVNSNLGSHTLLFHAVNIKNISLVEELMQYGANPWMVEVTGELPLHRAAVKGHVDIFNQLLKKMIGSNKIVDLREHSTSLVKKLMENNRSKTTQQDEDHMACLRRLLQKDVQLDLNQKYQDQTALHLAAAFNNQEAVSEMLRAGAYLGACHVVSGNDYGTILDSVLPGTLEQAMDGCITHYCEDDSNKDENVVSEDYTLHLDYRFLIPPQQEGTNSNPQAVNEVKTLMDVCRSSRHRHVIKHPLVQTLLHAKWRKALPLYLFNVSIYFFFVLVLTTFAYFLKDLRVMEARLSTLQQNSTNYTSLESSMQGQQTSVHVLRTLLLLAWLFMLVREIFQIRFSREYYLKNIENYLEWFLLVVVIVLCAAPMGVDFTRHLAAWAMIVAWYEFVLMLGRMPIFALYITMLRHASWNFLKLIILYSALIIAFTISFHIILQKSEDDQNESFWQSLPRAIVMSTGEFEYSDMSEKFPESMRISAIILFLVFVFAIFLVLMNVMNALAVTDAQEVVDDAKLYSLTSLLELVYLVETFLGFSGVRSCLGNLQLLSGPNNAPSLLAKINHPKKDQRLQSGLAYQTLTKLDNDTAECLRLHRLEHLKEEKNQQRNESAAQLEAAVQDLAIHHPQLLSSLAAALRPAQ